jgi:hypothetical protein
MRTRRRGAPEVSRTGARFPRLPPPDGSEADDDLVLPEDARPRDRSMIGATGARFRRGGSAEPLPTIDPFPEPAAPAAPPAPIPSTEPPPSAVGPDVEPVPGVAPVRPYVLTRGRTQPPVDLPLEALVTAGPAAARSTGSARALVQLCRVPRSVAEVAALAGLPLGVTRVLVGDLAAAGAVVIQRTAGADGPDLALLGRVLTGLRNL